MLNPRVILSNEGRVDRLTWWIWCIIIPIILLLFTQFISYLPPDSILIQIIGFVILGILFIELIIIIVVSIKRLHDTDKSGLYLILAIIPLINWVLLYYLAFQKGTIGSNKYGKDQSADKQNALLKKCPYCAEDIKFEAIVCRYCGRDIPVIHEKDVINIHNNQINPKYSTLDNDKSLPISTNAVGNGISDMEEDLWKCKKCGKENRGNRNHCFFVLQIKTIHRLLTNI